MHPQRSFLVLGSGGREHAIAWKLAQAADNPIVYVIPGNAGIAADPLIRGGCPSVSIYDFSALTQFAKHHEITLTVVGPEALLCAGLVDYFQQRNLPIFGPSKAAAQLEGSKAFSKEIMHSAGISTPNFEVFDDYSTAFCYVQQAKHPLVIKVDGLAAGKGVVVSSDLATSESTLRTFICLETPGKTSSRVVIEQFVQGFETSFMAITDGHNIVSLPTSRDYKRVFDNDLGPNTGGMGAVVPAPQTTARLENYVIQDVIHPVLRELERRGHPFTGFLYAGLMLNDENIHVLEFNVRLGDPETQALVYAMPDVFDLGLCLQHAANGTLKNSQIPVENPAVSIVMAAAGYPATPTLGDKIFGLQEIALMNDVKVFHAGTNTGSDGNVVTAAGRVLNVTARASTVRQAREAAYGAASKIQWKGAHYRKDIGRE